MAFFNSAVTVLQTLVIALGAGLGMTILSSATPKRNMRLWFTSSMVRW